MSKLTVTYIKHSGFLIETANSYLLFDYWQGKLPELQYDKELYIFSSHAHHDHYTKDIFKLENKCQRVVYVLSSDEAKMFAFPYLEASWYAFFAHCPVMMKSATLFFIRFIGIAENCWDAPP